MHTARRWLRDGCCHAKANETGGRNRASEARIFLKEEREEWDGESRAKEREGADARKRGRKRGERGEERVTEAEKRRLMRASE